MLEKHIKAQYDLLVQKCIEQRALFELQGVCKLAWNTGYRALVQCIYREGEVICNYWEKNK